MLYVDLKVDHDSINIFTRQITWDYHKLWKIKYRPSTVQQITQLGIANAKIRLILTNFCFIYIYILTYFAIWSL